MKIWPRISSWQDWLILAMCAAWVLCLVWIGHPESNLLKALWSQNMAAWVQAIGSIGAIIAVGYFPVWMQRRRAAQLRDYAGTIARSLAAYIFPTIMFLRNEDSREVLRRDGMPGIESLSAKLLETMPYAELADPDLTNFLFAIRGSLGSLTRLAGAILAAEEGSDEIARQISALWHLEDQLDADFRGFASKFDVSGITGKQSIEAFKFAVLAEAQRESWPGMPTDAGA